MTQQEIIADIEARAKLAKISMKDLCERANVHPTSFSRWKQSPDNPSPGGANLHKIEAIYRELIKSEKAAA